MSEDNFFQTMKHAPIRNSSHFDKEKKMHDEYISNAVNSKYLKVSKNLKEAPFTNLFLKEALQHIFKWLEQECNPETKQSFINIMNEIQQYESSENESIVRSTSDGTHHMISLYAPRTFTDNALKKVATWLRVKASNEQKTTFKSLMGTFHTYRSQEFHSITTSAEGFQNTPLYIPDKSLRRPASDVARQLHREKFRPIKLAPTLALSPDKNNITMKTSYNETFHGTFGAPSILLRPLLKKEPYGVLNGRHLKTTNQTMYPVYSNTEITERIDNNNKVTASIGASIPSWGNSLQKNDYLRIQEENLSLNKTLENTIQERDIPLHSKVRMNYSTENTRSFIPQKMYRESEKRAYENARKPKLQTPFAHTYTGYAFSSMLESQSKSTFTPQNTISKFIPETNFNRKKVPFYLQTIK